jgi:CRISPR-associated protein Csh1
MIREISQFVETIPVGTKAKAMEPKQGLHISVGFDSEGVCKVLHHEYFNKKKSRVYSVFIERCMRLQELAWMVDTNKCFDLPAKAIHTASPYCVAFKKESWAIGKEPATNYNKTLPERLPTYFSKCFDAKFVLTDIQIEETNRFCNFLRLEFQGVLLGLDEYHRLDESDYIIVYNDKSEKEYERFNGLYRQDKLFNTSEYNIVEHKHLYGTSNFFNGFNAKKPFLLHQTASFDINGRIAALDAQYLDEFEKLANKRVFPNPIPIFIDNHELTNESIEIYQRDDSRKTTYREIMAQLYRERGSLGNYYLLYFSAGQIKDFDFVAKFDYLLNGEEGWCIENVMGLLQNKDNLLPNQYLYNVFDFERVVITQLFNNSFVKPDKDTGALSLRYFDDLDAKYYRAATYTLAITYKTAVYDFIYKSMRSSIGVAQFYKICMDSILDDLKQDKKDYAIKLKLNILFSLYPHFNKIYNNLTFNIMASKVYEYTDQLREIVDKDDEYFRSDEEYAFGVGQLVYYLLLQSGSGNKTHALLEPVLQKSNQLQLNSAIVGLIAKYKHSISFGYRQFNNLAGKVLGYKSETLVKNNEAILLAGYFCPNILLRKKEQQPINN